MRSTPFPWLPSLLIKVGILSAGVACLLSIGWPIAESRDSADLKSTFISSSQARDVAPQGRSAKPVNVSHFPEKQVDLNKGTQDELERLPGIGKVLAQRIIDYRQTHGPFLTFNALGDVSGIGRTKVNELRPLVEVLQKH